jgi:hypothetical protein
VLARSEKESLASVSAFTTKMHGEEQMTRPNSGSRNHALCNRICTMALAYALGISVQWDVPLSRYDTERWVRKDLRLAVIDRHIHYYKRNASGQEYEIAPEGFLPQNPEEHLNPPAIEEQLQATEDLLGFSLPPLLRALYQQVANGAFGPSNGLFGALGGGDKDNILLTEEYFLRRGDNQPIDLFTCELSPMAEANTHGLYLASWEIEIPQGYWPDRLLPLIQDGCGLFFFLDIPSDRVFYSGTYPLRLWLVANSLEDFFERWMRGEIN